MFSSSSTTKICLASLKPLFKKISWATNIDFLYIWQKTESFSLYRENSFFESKNHVYLADTSRFANFSVKKIFIRLRIASRTSRNFCRFFGVGSLLWGGSGKPICCLLTPPKKTGHFPLASSHRVMT